MDLLKRIFQKIVFLLKRNLVYKWILKKVTYNHNIIGISSPAYSEKFLAQWFPIYPRQTIKRVPPICYGSLEVNLQEKCENEFPEAGVLKLDDAYIYGRDGWIFTKEKFFLYEHSWYGKYFFEIKNIPRILPQPITKLKGITMSLASESATTNYGHWLLDSIGRLALFKDAGFAFADVDHILCPKPISEAAWNLFKCFNIPEEKCIWTHDNHAKTLHCETLIALTFPGTRRNYAEWMTRFIQKEFFLKFPQPLKHQRRLYITRSGASRNIVNEESIIQILRKYNFEIYNPMFHNHPQYDFAQAQAIVGPHGAGLTDLVFCRSNTRVLELIPSDHIFPYYYTLAECLDLNYGYLICQSLKKRKTGSYGPSPYDFFVNEDEFEDAIVKILDIINSK